MRLPSVDRDLSHLYPPFRDKLFLLLQMVELRTERPWMLVEGYRSPERQLFLYGYGRPHLSGPPFFGRKGRIVTWRKTPSFHGTGCAADCAPKKKVLGVYVNRPEYGVPDSFWEAYREIWSRLDLQNEAWSHHDYGHVQATGWEELGRVWTRRRLEEGFLDFEESRLDTPVRVFVDGVEIQDAYGALVVSTGRIWMRLRPVIEALDGVILSISRVSSGEITWGSHMASVLLPEMELMILPEKSAVLPVMLGPDSRARVAAKMLGEHLGFEVVVTEGRISLLSGRRS